MQLRQIEKLKSPISRARNSSFLDMKRSNENPVSDIPFKKKKLFFQRQKTTNVIKSLQNRNIISSQSGEKIKCFSSPNFSATNLNILMKHATGEINFSPSGQFLIFPVNKDILCYQYRGYNMINVDYTKSSICNGETAYIDFDDQEKESLQLSDSVLSKKYQIFLDGYAPEMSGKLVFFDEGKYFLVIASKNLNLADLLETSLQENQEYNNIFLNTVMDAPKIKNYKIIIIETATGKIHDSYSIDKAVENPVSSISVYRNVLLFTDIFQQKIHIFTVEDGKLEKAFSIDSFLKQKFLNFIFFKLLKDYRNQCQRAGSHFRFLYNYLKQLKLDQVGLINSDNILCQFSPESTFIKNASTEPTFESPCYFIVYSITTNRILNTFTSIDIDLADLFRENMLTGDHFYHPSTACDLQKLHRYNMSSFQRFASPVQRQISPFTTKEWVCPANKTFKVVDVILSSSVWPAMPSFLSNKTEEKFTIVPHGKAVSRNWRLEISKECKCKLKLIYHPTDPFMISIFTIYHKSHPQIPIETVISFHFKK